MKVIRKPVVLEIVKFNSPTLVTTKFGKVLAASGDYIVKSLEKDVVDICSRDELDKKYEMVSNIAPVEPLNDLQILILKLIVQGFNNNVIISRLKMSKATVEQNSHQLYEKLPIPPNMNKRAWVALHAAELLYLVKNTNIE